MNDDDIDDIVYANGCFHWLARLVYSVALVAACAVLVIGWAWL